MKVAWHEVPGLRATSGPRPVGNGMKGLEFKVCNSEKPSRKKLAHLSWEELGRSELNQTVPSGTGFSMHRFQAFHAWLPSLSPSGTTISKT
jgi:hypothetical protein